MRARALSLVRDVPDKKHVLSRKTGGHGSSCTRMRPWHVLRASARERAETVYTRCMRGTHRGPGIRNFRPTYTRVIYYVARGEHMSHLHIAWYRKRGSRLPTVRAICEKFQQKAVSAPPLSQDRSVCPSSAFFSSFFPPFFRPRPSGGRLIEKTESCAIYENVLLRCTLCANRRKGTILSSRPIKPHFERFIHERKTRVPFFPNSLIYLSSNRIPECG